MNESRDLAERLARARHAVLMGLGDHADRALILSMAEVLTEDEARDIAERQDDAREAAEERDWRYEGGAR